MLKVWKIGESFDMKHHISDSPSFHINCPSHNRNSIIYFVRFHIYPNTKIVKTKAGNSIIISLINGEGWLLNSETNSFEIEKNIFFGNKNKIINNESVYVSGNINEEITSIKWIIERVS